MLANSTYSLMGERVVVVDILRMFTCVCLRGLENNSVAETLSLQHCIEEKPFPCAYIKIGMCVLI